LISSKRSGSDSLAWGVALGAALAGIPFLVWGLPALTGVDAKLGRLLADMLPRAWRAEDGRWAFAAGAMLTTVLYTGTALLLALLGGVAVGVARTMRSPWLRLPASIYVEFVRGVPLLVILLCAVFGLNRPIQVGGWTVHMSKFSAAVLGLAVCYAAYIGEIIRAGVEAIPKEVLEAAYLETGHWQVSTRVALPLAARKTLPAIGNEFIALLKDSSLVSVVGIHEMTLAAKVHAGVPVSAGHAGALAAGPGAGIGLGRGMNGGRRLSPKGASARRSPGLFLLAGRAGRLLEVVGGPLAFADGRGQAGRGNELGPQIVHPFLEALHELAPAVLLAVDGPRREEMKPLVVAQPAAVMEVPDLDGARLEPEQPVGEIGQAQHGEQFSQARVVERDLADAREQNARPDEAEVAELHRIGRTAAVPGADVVVAPDAHGPRAPLGQVVQNRGERRGIVDFVGVHDQEIVGALVEGLDLFARRSVVKDAFVRASRPGEHLGVAGGRLVGEAPRHQMDFPLGIGMAQDALDGAVGLDGIAEPIAVVLRQHADPRAKGIQRPQQVREEHLLVEGDANGVDAQAHVSASGLLAQAFPAREFAGHATGPLIRGNLIRNFIENQFLIIIKSNKYLKKGHDKNICCGNKK
jgi:His/Glu/Gln/Arg/opine family amino acid ABC transporter permease subunit